jgi:uncharacterized protein YecT (DUF1311 family)
MRSILLLSLSCVLFLGLTVPSHAQDKSDGESPASIQAWTGYHQVDQELTDLCQKIMISLDSATVREKFTDSENVWLKFRKAQGEFAAEGAPDKTTYKLRMAASFTEATKARIAELKKWQDDQPKK